MLEKMIEQKLGEAVKAKRGMCLKQTGIKGIPDRMVLLHDGKIGFVEVKQKGKKPRVLQVFRMKQLELLGFNCFVLDDVEQIGGIIDAIQSS